MKELTLQQQSYIISKKPKKKRNTNLQLQFLLFKKFLFKGNVLFLILECTFVISVMLIVPRFSQLFHLLSIILITSHQPNDTIKWFDQRAKVWHLLQFQPIWNERIWLAFLNVILFYLYFISFATMNIIISLLVPASSCVFNV